MASTGLPSARDLRIDFFRGVALMMIFINHLPESPFSALTLRNWGLSDSAEVFVLLAGVAAALAYGRLFERDGFMAGTRAVLSRMRTLYVTHLALFALVGVLCVLGATLLDETSYLERLGYAAFLAEPLRHLPEVLALMFQPELMDILPLYVVLLGFLPLIALLARAHRFAPLSVSLLVYASAQLAPLPLPNGVRDAGVWFFNPLAWQALFVIGFTLGKGMRAPTRPPLAAGLRHTLTGFALVYTALAVLVVSPWRALPGLEQLWLVDPNLLAVANKSQLHPLRLIDILAKLWLVTRLVPAGSRWLESMPARPVLVMGRNALPVFAASSVLAVGSGIILMARPELPLFPGVEIGGILAMVALGYASDLRRGGVLAALPFLRRAPRPAA